jgi:hypothetical protein
MSHEQRLPSVSSTVRGQGTRREKDVEAYRLNCPIARAERKEGRKALERRSNHVE